MAASAANTPVIIGIAHVDQHIDEPSAAQEPLDLMLQAVRQAAEDAGTGAALKADAVRVVRGIWPYENPAQVIASAIGVEGAETALTPYGGNFVQSAINASCVDIANGTHELIVLTGAECGATQARAGRKGVELAWRDAPGTPDRLIGTDVEMRHEAEKAIRIGRPIQVYPIFETALRHQLGHGIEEHQTVIAELWASFAAVAANNPHAWIRDGMSAEEIRTPSAVNRPVSFPYPKFMNSNNNVDQGAAVILASVEKATALGIPETQWVYPWAGTDAHDHYFVSNRDTLYESPAIRIAGKRCLALAGLTVDELDHVDVYSCFPSAVQIAARELGLPTSRPLTVTGGLTWAGGPLNNYVMHSVVRMVELLREAPAAKGLITANGGYLTKHAFGVYSATAPTTPFRHEDLQDQVDAEPLRDVVMNFQGTAEVEGYSVMYGADGLDKAFVAARTPGGERAWGVCEDAATLKAMTEEEFCGRNVQLSEHVASF